MISRSSSTYKPLSDRTKKPGDPELASSPRDQEMTHISVMPPTDSLVTTNAASRVHHKLMASSDLYDGLPPKTRGQGCSGCGMTWTNFHCILCIGVAGFMVFWIFLLLRMYLPLESGVMTWWLGPQGKKSAKIP